MQFMSLEIFASNYLYKRLVNIIDQVCKKNNVDQTHGLAHALKIGSETYKALLSQKSVKVDDLICENVVCAALLHDIDDRKYFKSNNYQNARYALQSCAVPQKRMQNILLMIDLVSFSKNGNLIDEKYPSIYYLPRYVDRSEAIGIEGLYRSYIYNKNRHFDILFDSDTPRPKNVEELYKCAEGRDVEYMKSGNSKTVVDHFFDKLVHISLPGYVQNSYLIDLYRAKHEEMVHFIIRQAANDYRDYQRDLKCEYEVKGRRWESLQ